MRMSVDLPGAVTPLRREACRYCWLARGREVFSRHCGTRPASSTCPVIGPTALSARQWFWRGLALAGARLTAQQSIPRLGTTSSRIVFVRAVAWARSKRYASCGKRRRSFVCLVQVGNGIELDTVCRQFEPYRWRPGPCGVTWDVVPE